MNYLDFLDEKAYFQDLDEWDHVESVLVEFHHLQISV